MGSTKKRRIGAPLALDRIIREADDQHEAVTAADRVVDAVRAGNSVAVAAAAAGIAKSTFLDYLAVGARVNARMAAFRESNPGLDSNNADYTAKELACADFSDRIFVAQAEFEVAALVTIDEVARGGIPTETVWETHEQELDADGQPTGQMRLVDRRTKTSETLPDWRAMMQRLIHRHPDRYARNRLEHYLGDAPSAEPDLSEDEAASIALANLRALPPIETTATDITEET